MAKVTLKVSKSNRKAVEEVFEAGLAEDVAEIVIEGQLKEGEILLSAVGDDTKVLKGKVTMTVEDIIDPDTNAPFEHHKDHTYTAKLGKTIVVKKSITAISPYNLIGVLAKKLVADANKKYLDEIKAEKAEENAKVKEEKKTAMAAIKAKINADRDKIKKLRATQTEATDEKKESKKEAKKVEAASEEDAF